MNVARVLLVALIATSASATVVGQWKWRDRNGVMQYSDLPPPHGTPVKDILQRPQVFQRQAASAAAEAASAPATAASGPVAAASAPRGELEGELEVRRRQVEIDKAEKAAKELAARRAEEQRIAAVRADNCLRARTTLRALDDGVRMARTNAQGEREPLDDQARAEETARMRRVVASDCK